MTLDRDTGHITRAVHWSNPENLRRPTMTLTEQIELARSTKDLLQERASREDAPPALRLAFTGAATLVGTALATAAGARNEIVARGTLAGMIGAAALDLGRFQKRHPEYGPKIDPIPGMLADIANDVKA